MIKFILTLRCSCSVRPPPVVFCSLLEFSLGNPYLKILDLKNFLLWMPIWKIILKNTLTPSQSPFKYWLNRFRYLSKKMNDKNYISFQNFENYLYLGLFSFPLWKYYYLDIYYYIVFFRLSSENNNTYTYGTTLIRQLFSITLYLSLDSWLFL